MTRNELFCPYSLLLRSPLFLFLTFVSCHASISPFSPCFPLLPSHLELQCLRHQNKHEPNWNGSMKLFLLQRCDHRDSCAAHLPIVFSQIRRHRQYKHIWSCVSQYCGRFPLRQFTGVWQSIAAGIGTSNFLRAFFSWCVWIFHLLVQWRRYHVIALHYRTLVSR